MSITKPSLDHTDRAYRMYQVWIAQTDTDLRALWYRTHLSFWMKHDKPMATIRWAPFDLDIASFAIPDEDPPSTATEEWPVDQCLYWDESEEGKPSIAYDKSKNVKTRATVAEIVDAFLSGEWTPPWCCTSCRKRYNKTVKPL